MSPATSRTGMLLSFVTLGLSLLCLMPFAMNQREKAESPGGSHENWTELFNGRDLQGWTVKSKPADRDKRFWKVDNGTILADSMGYNGHDYVWLTTDREFSDFVLQLEFQAYKDSPGNTGVQVRSRYDDAAFWLDGPQIDVNPPEPWRTGMMWDETRGNQRWIFPNLPKGTWVDPSMAKPERVFRYAEEGDSWNQLEVTAEGMDVRAVLNGVTITEFEGRGLLDDDLHQARRVGRSGIIALQIHTGDQLRARFRHLRIRQLNGPASLPETPGPTSFRIQRGQEGWILLRSGSPFFIKGAVGQDYLDRLNEGGGNAVRLWSRFSEGLDSASKNNLVALVTLPLRGERDRMDWNDDVRVKEQTERVIKIVQEIKDHPALMMYSLGNELDWIPPGKPYNRRLWDVINELAGQIRRLDPDHPVMTVVGDSDFSTKVVEIARQCPNLDLLGINSYGNLEEIAALTRKHWNRPYVVTEWGPVGHWQVPKTDWGAPREQTSSQKAQSYLDHYVTAIRGDAENCLGGFAFFWGHRQEITHTWYGMFSSDGLASEAVGVMQYLWTGHWPENLAPKIKLPRIDRFGAEESIRVKPGARYSASVDVEDPDADPLRFDWEIKPEVEPAAYAGIGEKPASPIAGLVEEQSGSTVSFSAPRKPGPYRLFTSVYDGKGHWAYANLPFLVVRD